MNKQKNELIIALKQLANNMTEVADLLAEYKHDTFPRWAQALVGASMMVKEWASNVELEG